MTSKKDHLQIAEDGLFHCGLGWKTGESGLFFDQFRVVFAGIQFDDLTGLRINDPFSNVDDMVADALQLTTDDQVDVRGF